MPAESTVSTRLTPSKAAFRREVAAWFATGLGRVPLFIVLTVFGYVCVTSLGGVLASPFLDLPDTYDDSYLGGVLGLALFGLLLAGPPFLVVCAVYLAILRHLSLRGWTERRLRRAAVGGGLLVTLPFVILAPMGALFGLVLPLPRS